jgi:hypothetical protein
MSVLRTSLVTVLALGVAGSIVTRAQAVPRLDAPPTVWFQRGTTQQLTLTGDALGGATAVLVTGSGASGVLGAAAPKAAGATVLESSRGGLSVGSAATSDAKTVTLQWMLAADAPLGSREVRIATTNGVSNPVTLQVSDLPELMESDRNHSLADAQRVSLPTGISGVIRASTENDWYRFTAKAGERLIFDVQANRTGSPLDATLVLLDASGKELARSEDAHGLDPFIDFTPKTDGEFALQIFDVRFQGGGNYSYHLVAGALPYLERRFPFGGKRGTSVDVALTGIHLDGRDRLTIAIDPNAPPGVQDIRLRTPRGSSNPLPFEAGDLPEFSETEPNQSITNANPVSAPVVINGVIGTPRDADTFRIKATADGKLVAEVRARRLGSPLDALLTLSDAKGAVLQRNDDASGPDARIEWDAKKDTEYFLSLRDLTDRGGAAFGYRVSVQPPDTTPDFAVRFAQDRVRVHAGGHVAVRCEVDRINGFNGAVRITGGNLPAGVSAGTLVIGPEGPQSGWLDFSAAANTPVGHHALMPQAEAVVAGTRRVTHPVVFPAAGFLSVIAPAPFNVEAITPTVSIAQDGTATVSVQVLRQAGFTGEVRVAVDDLPGVSIPAVTVAGDSAQAVLKLSAAYTAEASIRSLQIRGEATIDGQTVTSHAGLPVPVVVTPIPVYLTAMLPGSPFFRTDAVKLSVIALPAATGSPARLTEFVVKADRRAFNGMIPLKLEDLPEGVTATVEPLGEGGKLATIRLAASEKTPPKDYTMTVVGTFTAGDRIWNLRTQKITLQVTAPEKEAPTSTPPVAAPTAAK